MPVLESHSNGISVEPEEISRFDWLVCFCNKEGAELLEDDQVFSSSRRSS